MCSFTQYDETSSIYHRLRIPTVKQTGLLDLPKFDKRLIEKALITKVLENTSRSMDILQRLLIKSINVYIYIHYEHIIFIYIYIYMLMYLELVS